MSLSHPFHEVSSAMQPHAECSERKFLGTTATPLVCRYRVLCTSPAPLPGDDLQVACALMTGTWSGMTSMPSHNRIYTITVVVQIHYILSLVYLSVSKL